MNECMIVHRTLKENGCMENVRRIPTVIDGDILNGTSEHRAFKHI